VGKVGKSKFSDLEKFFEEIDEETLLYLHLTGNLEKICNVVSIDHQQSIERNDLSI
jgi:hypothetical protein